MSQLSVPRSPQMEFLLKDPVIRKQLAVVFPILDTVLMQIMLDVTSPDNASTVGHDILAIRRVRDIFTLFATGGQVDLKNEESKKKQ
jgi:hypothetical protein